MRRLCSNSKASEKPVISTARRPDGGKEFRHTEILQDPPISIAIWLVPVGVGMAIAVAAGLAELVDPMSMSMFVGVCGRTSLARDG